MSAPFARRTLLGLLPCLLGVMIGWGGARPALAQQQESPCAATLAAAQADYVDQAFEQAEALLRECLNRPDMDEETALAVHRLLALVYLRQDDIAEARQSVVRLLGVSFEYEPDPVQDPPAYVALVASIKEQLRVEREVVAAPELPPDSVSLPTPEPAVPVFSREPYRVSRALSVHATLGAGSYGGERGRAASWLIEEFTDNAGISLSLGAGFSFNPMLAATLTYRLHHIPRLFVRRSVDLLSGLGPIEPEASSKWVQLFELLGRAYYRPEGQASSYVELGVSASVSRINDTVRTGFGPRGGLGLDIALTPELAGFAGLSATLIFPGDAVDFVDAQKNNTNQRNSDLLSFAEVGVRYRLKAW